MWAFVTATASTIVLAAVVAVFVAYPGRNREIPRADWLNDRVAKATNRLADDLAEPFVRPRR
jgi:lysophospholipase L1-like esterase